MTEPYRNPIQVYDEPQYDVELHGHLYQWVAWHRGGHVTLAIGKRHLREHGHIRTLCRVNVGKGRARVSPLTQGTAPGGGYWHTGDCSRCLREAEKRGAT